jgi:uncharacterized protein YwqG
MAIKLVTQHTTRPLVGKSHWWGAPDLPADVPYPTVEVTDGKVTYDEPLTFLCQIRCDELAPFDTDHLLPTVGMLWFFAPLDYFLGETDSPLDYHIPPRVIYSRHTEGLKPYYLTWEDSGKSIFRPAEKIVFTVADQDSGDGLMMLSKPYQDEVSCLHEHDICLLQVDEDDRWHLRFYDCGMYYIFLPARDLMRRSFERTAGELFYY